MKSIDPKRVVQHLRASDGDFFVLIPGESFENEEDRQRNVFRVSKSGEVRWQIARYPSTGVSTFTNILHDGKSLGAYNFDGGLFLINPDDGSVIDSVLMK